MSAEQSAERNVQVGDQFTWALSPGSLIEVLGVGRKYARIRVTQPNGGSWTKRQPLPFPPAFMRLTPPAATEVAQ